MTGRDSAETSGYLPSYSAFALIARATYSRPYSSRASTTSASIAPAASARSRIASQYAASASGTWPTSTAIATTSAPHSSWIHRTATDVSSPPEYASTTRLAFTGCTTARLSFVLQAGQLGQATRDLAPTDALGAHHDERVVTGDVPEHVGEAGAVQRRAHHVRTPGRRPQQREVRGVRHLDHELPHHPAQVLVGRVRLVLGVLRHRVRHRPAGDAHLDRAQLLEVAAHGRLRREDPLGAEQLHDLGLARDHLLLEQAGEAVLALGLAERGHQDAPCSESADCSSTSWSSARAACSRFAACCHTRLAGPSSTSSVTSSPRWAGRQW